MAAGTRQVVIKGVQDVLTTVLSCLALSVERRIYQANLT